MPLFHRIGRLSSLPDPRQPHRVGISGERVQTPPEIYKSGIPSIPHPLTREGGVPDPQAGAPVGRRSPRAGLHRSLHPVPREGGVPLPGFGCRPTPRRKRPSLRCANSEIRWWRRPGGGSVGESAPRNPRRRSAARMRPCGSVRESAPGNSRRRSAAGYLAKRRCCGRRSHPATRSDQMLIGGFRVRKAIRPGGRTRAALRPLETPGANPDARFNPRRNHSPGRRVETGVASESRAIVCHERRPHSEHRMNDRVNDRDAFHRIPPKSQIDLAKPHRQRTIQVRESASIDSAQCRGKIAVKNL